ncbi:hypothetical protein L828_0268 [Mycobacteroides abscessus MAB_030201_1061]|nr:hypothetical protein L835_0258 [Mycobacteroides abscessus MAB_110811_1470]ETZ96065.1 hypothetical protein L828_0268 [Mycobacteroides abscessus MAB_030201_1061]
MSASSAHKFAACFADLERNHMKRGAELARYHRVEYEIHIHRTAFLKDVT